jgi:hypothetical protein
MDTLRPADHRPEALVSPTKPEAEAYRLLLTMITSLHVIQLLLPAPVALLDPQHKMMSLELVITVGRLATLVVLGALLVLLIKYVR